MAGGEEAMSALAVEGRQLNEKLFTTSVSHSGGLKLLQFHRSSTGKVAIGL